MKSGLVLIKQILSSELTFIDKETFLTELPSLQVYTSPLKRQIHYCSGYNRPSFDDSIKQAYHQITSICILKDWHIL